MRRSNDTGARNALASGERIALADVLIVEDEHALADALADVLASEGHEVRTASDGRAGLEKIDERRPDLILLDIEMPSLSGPAMIRRLEGRAPGEMRSIPVILMSGLPRLEVVAESLGTSYYLKKPFSAESLLRMVATALRVGKDGGHGAPEG